jgi:site-specific recombinase XerD
MIKLLEHFEEYINECIYVKRLRPASIKCSKDALIHFRKLMPEIESLEDITATTITVFFKRMQTRERIIGKGIKVVGVRDSSLLTYGSRLKTFFKWLADRRYIQHNPFVSMRLPNPTFEDRRALSGDQIKRIMGAIVQYSYNSFLIKRDIAMVGMLTFCGLRRTELISLEVRDIDLLNGLITVKAETSKSRRIRMIPMNTNLKYYVKEYLQQRKVRGCKTPYFFVSHTADRGITLGGLKHWVTRLVRLSGVKFHLHRFRHTFATNLAIQDIGVIKIQKLMGHTDLKMTQKYVRSISTLEMKEDINKLSFENLA